MRHIACAVALALVGCSEEPGEEIPTPLPTPFSTPQVSSDVAAPDGGRVYALLRQGVSATIETYSVQQAQMLTPIDVSPSATAIDVERVSGLIAVADSSASVVSILGQSTVAVPGARDVAFTPRVNPCCDGRPLLFATGEGGIVPISWSDIVDGTTPFYEMTATDLRAAAVAPDGGAVAAARGGAGEAAYLSVYYDSVELTPPSYVPSFLPMTTTSCGAPASHAVAFAGDDEVVAWDAACDAFHFLIAGTVVETSGPDGALAETAHAQLATILAADELRALSLTTAGLWSVPVPPATSGSAALVTLPGAPVVLAPSIRDTVWVGSDVGGAPHLEVVSLPLVTSTAAAGFTATGTFVDLVYLDRPATVVVPGGLEVLAGNALEIEIGIADADGDLVEWEILSPADVEVTNEITHRIRWETDCEEDDQEVLLSVRATSGKLVVTNESTIRVKGRDCRTEASRSEVAGVEIACSATADAGRSPLVTLCLLASAFAVRALRSARAGIPRE